jgi:hypothetical protein
VPSSLSASGVEELLGENRLSSFDDTSDSPFRPFHSLGDLFNLTTIDSQLYNLPVDRGKPSQERVNFIVEFSCLLRKRALVVRFRVIGRWVSVLYVETFLVRNGSFAGRVPLDGPEDFSRSNPGKELPEVRVIFENRNPTFIDTAEETHVGRLNNVLRINTANHFSA